MKLFRAQDRILLSGLWQLGVIEYAVSRRLIGQLSILTLSLVETAKREDIVKIFSQCRLFDHSVKIIIHLMMNLKLTILVLGFAPVHGRFDVFQNMKSWQSSQQKWLIFWRLIFTKMIYFSMNNVKYYLISSADIYTCTTINLI